MDKKSCFLAAATAAMLVTSGLNVAQAATHFCANTSCKGKSECKGHGNNTCKGKNECKGHGFIKAADEAECKKAGGEWKTK